jgi:hypothetical protein
MIDGPEGQMSSEIAVEGDHAGTACQFPAYSVLPPRNTRPPVMTSLEPFRRATDISFRSGIREKGPDIEIAPDMNDFSRNVTPPGTMILIAGDWD